MYHYPSGTNPCEATTNNCQQICTVSEATPNIFKCLCEIGDADPQDGSCQEKSEKDYKIFYSMDGQIKSLDKIGNDESVNHTTPTMRPTLVILAAGMGSRYGGLKQIDPMVPTRKFYWIMQSMMPFKQGLAR